MDFRAQKRREMDSRFRDLSRIADNWGQQSSVEGDRVGRHVNGKDHQAKVQAAQKEMRQILNLKMRDNQARGAKLGQEI